MIAIIDYGAGNLRSVHKAFDYLETETVITSDPDVIMAAEKAILPGVGAFGDAMDQLTASGLDKVVMDFIASGKPFLGICLGLHLLFEESEETPGVKGLGYFKGKILKIKGKDLKIPQMGWNKLKFNGECKLFDGIKDGEYMYFVHSYYAKPENKEDSAATVIYGDELDIAVHKNNVYATQFHPEKSGTAGLKLLENFANM